MGASLKGIDINWWDLGNCRAQSEFGHVDQLEEPTDRIYWWWFKFGLQQCWLVTVPTLIFMPNPALPVG
jgi:hypothetical protein